MLEDEGFRVLVARHGREALQLLREDRRIGLILLDLVLPEVNGPEFRSWQLADPELRHIPVVVISGEENAAQVSRELGARSYLKKPIELEALLKIAAAYPLPLTKGGA